MEPQILWELLKPYPIASDVALQEAIMNKYEGKNFRTFWFKENKVLNMVTNFVTNGTAGYVLATPDYIAGLGEEIENHFFFFGLLELRATEYGQVYEIRDINENVVKKVLVESPDVAKAIECMMADIEDLQVEKARELAPEFLGLVNHKFTDHWMGVSWGRIPKVKGQGNWYKFQDVWINDHQLEVDSYEVRFKGHFTVSSLVIHPEFYRNQDLDRDFARTNPWSAEVVITQPGHDWEIRIFHRYSANIVVKFLFQAEDFSKAVEVAIDKLKWHLSYR